MRTLLTATLLAMLMSIGGIVSILISSAQAETTGLASMHTLQQQGNRLCMVGHFHYGSGSSSQGKTVALAKAKRSWADFVIVEYGTNWSRFSIASARGIKCTGNNSTYSCSIEASPCKSSAGRSYAAKPSYQKPTSKKRRYNSARYRTTSYRSRAIKKRRNKKRRKSRSYRFSFGVMFQH